MKLTSQMVSDLLDADVLTGEDGTQIDLATPHADAAALRDGDGLVFGKGSRGR